MAVHKLYESASFVGTWAGIDVLKGKSADTFLTIEPRGPRNSVTTGCDGHDAVAKMANRGAVITVNTLVTSTDAEKVFSVIAAQDVIGADVPIGQFMVKDAHDVCKFLALNAKITEVPTWEFNDGSSLTNLTFVWECEGYFMGADLSSVQSQINELMSYV